MPNPQGRTKPRSYHTKSRGGCGTCKKRHIKCDEKRPACTNCITRHLHCPFQDAVSGGTGTTTAKLQGAGSLLSPPSGADSDSNHASPSSPLQHGATDVSIVHLELYNHYIFHVCPTFTGQPEHDENYRNLIIKTAFRHHFVLYEMLGVAALSRLRSSLGGTNKALAASFREKALADLDDVLAKINSETCVAVVIFAHLIGIHSFCDTFSSAEHDTFSDFLQALVGSAQLLRGINAVIRPFWNDLASTEVGEFMKAATTRRDQMLGRSAEETASLWTLIHNADITESSRTTYEESIAFLQRDFNEVFALDFDQRATTHTAFTWLITSTPAYLQLLGEARPEALVILSYYAVVLHHRRRCWAIGTAGYTLLKLITSHLGWAWKQWLAWPQNEIGKDFPDVLM